MLFYDLDRFSEDLDFNFSDKQSINVMNDRLIELWYNFESKNTNYWKVFNVEYWKNENKFHCAIDLAEYRYDIKPEFDIKFFWGKSIKVMSLSHNFAHKISAFYERKKGRDVVDINFYLSKGVIPNNDILIERHNKDFKQNIVLFLKELQTPYVNQRLEKALNQLHYKNYSLTEYKDNIVKNLSNNYTKDGFNFNLSYKEDIKKWNKIIPLTDKNSLIIDWKNLNNNFIYKYNIVTQSEMKLIYWCNTDEKLYEYINGTILPNSLEISKKWKINNLRIS